MRRRSPTSRWVAAAATALAILAGTCASTGLLASSTAMGPGKTARLHAASRGPDHKLVFAHYFPASPLSLDNIDPARDYYATQYLRPEGENGQYAANGGLLRDRPLPRPPRAGDNWRLLDLEEEVRQAKSVGIDGFSIDVITPTGSPDPITPVPSLLLQAAEQVGGFKVMLMPDASGPLGDLAANTLADQMAALAASPAAYHLADGRLVIAPFMAERHPAPWWADFVAQMREWHGINVAFVPVFLDEPNNVEAFTPISYGISMWGGRNPAFNPTGSYSTSRIASVRNTNRIWMQPVSVQDERPNQRIYDEAENTTNLRNTWQIAIDSDSEWVQLVTWNDYSEGTAFAPSVHHGWAFLTASAYYIQWFKTGVPPPVTADKLILTHRTQRADAAPTYPETALMTIRPNGSPSRDTVEVLSMLTAPGRVTIRIDSATHSCDVPAGVAICAMDLPTPGPQAASVSAELQRNNATSSTVSSPFPVVARPFVQDLQYTATVS